MSCVPQPLREVRAGLATGTGSATEAAPPPTVLQPRFSDFAPLKGFGWLDYSPITVASLAYQK
jgi:hypothetical protein